MIPFQQFEELLNRTIFGEDKEDIFRKLAECPERFVGLFRPTKPKSKIFQNLLQSHEIRFGDAIEKVFDAIIEEEGFSHKIKRLDRLDADGSHKILSIDLFFESEDAIYLVEQKVRDDHDSTKKVGQVDNFEAKIEYAQRLYPDKTIYGIMFFVDPAQTKNKRYYINRLSKIEEDYGVRTFIFYGEPFFRFISPDKDIWGEIIAYLTIWRESLADFPIVDMDDTPEDTATRLAAQPPLYWRKFLDNNDLWDQGIVKVLFTTGESLRRLAVHFSGGNTKIEQTLTVKLQARIDQYYALP